MLTVVAAVTERDGKIMICQRRPEVHNGLKWEFPGGKIEPGESPEAALARELREELAIEVRVGRIRDALLLFYGCALVSGAPRAVDCNAVAWVTPEALGTYDFAGADLKFIQRNYR